MMDKNGYFEEAFANFGNALANACCMFEQALDCFIEKFPKAIRQEQSVIVASLCEVMHMEYGEAQTDAC